MEWKGISYNPSPSKHQQPVGKLPLSLLLWWRAGSWVLPYSLPSSNSHLLGWEPRNFLCLVETDGLGIYQVYAVFFSPWLLSKVETKAFSSLMQNEPPQSWPFQDILLTCVALCLLYDARQCLLNGLANEDQVFGIIWTQFLSQKFLNNGLEANGTERLGNHPRTVQTTSSMLRQWTHIFLKLNWD